MNQLEAIQLGQTEAFKKGFEDFDFFSKLCLPHTVSFNFPIHYLSIWQMLVSARTKEQREAVLRFALGLPRGFAKTTFIKILICWFIVYDFTVFVLVVCADEPLAYNLLADLDEMLGSKNMETVYGKWTVNKAIDNKEQKTCFYRRKPRILVAVGAGSNVRGLNIKHERPDLILFDDMQTADNAMSEVESNQLLVRFVGTFLKLGNPQFVLIIYIGNMYPGNCILAKLRDNKSWISLITGCILADGSSLWPELHPLHVLYEGFKHDQEMGLGYIWFAEMMNDPIESRTSLLPNGTIPECPYTAEDIENHVIGGFVVVDPAGMRSMSDDNVIATHLLVGDIEDAKPILVDGIGGILDPEKVIEAAIEQCLRYNLSVIGIETVAYQQTLAFWMNKALATHNEFSHIIVVELSPAGRHKEFRISAWIQEVLSNNYYVFGEIRLKILWQALAYKLGKKKNKDDWLDAGAYGMDMKANYWEEIIQTAIDVTPGPQARVLTNNTPF